jgi:putative copper resistance protein D
MGDTLVVVRLVQFAASMVLLGAPCFALALATASPDQTELQQAFETWLRRWLAAAAVAAFVTSLLWLDLEAGMMGNGWDRMVDPGTISAVLFQTVFGRAWSWHLGLGAALVAVVASGRAGVLPYVVALAAAHLASLAWAGHAVMRPGLSGVPVMAAHLMAGGLWIGSLPALHHLAAMARVRGAAEARAALRRMLPLYSRAGYGAVGLVLLTGVLNSLLLMGSIRALLVTSFGHVLLVKIALVLAMVAIAADNRFIIQPRILAIDDVRAVPISTLWKSVAWEQAVAALVLASVSLLGTLPPSP